MLSKNAILLILVFLVLGSHSFANKIKNTNQAKTLQAYRTDVRPVVDGEIDAIFDKNTFKANNFTTFEPTPGLPSEYETEVSIIYDDDAIFIAAKLYDKDVKNMLKDLSPRDRTNNSDFFGVVFDPYQTGISGYTFMVTAAGVQVDIKETGDDGDSSWNEVWKSEISINDDGWTVEMAIPYSALRFPTGEVNNWNIQFLRSVRRTREKSFWNPVDPAIDGFLTQMGTLENIRDINAPLRLSVTPYVGLQLNTIQELSGGIGLSPKFAGGLDLKYGINEAFTLDMILIPDFSQVRSDIQVLNLSPFEVRFDENRPFFTEGLELFNTADIFYTRRIGGKAFLRSDISSRDDFEEFTKLSGNNLVNATKISGRTNSNTGLGFFNAVETPTYAEFIDTSGMTQRVLANPLTNYNVIVVEQALKNNSKIGFINTNVTRTGKHYDANVTGLQWNLRNNSQSYNVKGKYVNSQKYYSDHLDQGYSYNLEIGKISGQWNFGAETFVESADYDINDLGFLFSPNERTYYTWLAYNEYSPKNDKIGSYRISQNVGYESLFQPNVLTGISTHTEFFLRLKSFDAFGIWLDTEPIGSFDYFEPRTADFSRFVKNERSFNVGGFISSDYRKPLALDVRTNYSKFDFEGKSNLFLRVSPRIRLNSKIFIVPSFQYYKTSNQRGFVFYADQPNLEFGQDILIGLRDVTSYTNTINGQFNISNKMSFDLEISHYFSTVKYNDFGLLNNDGILEDVVYDELDDNGISIHNRNYNFFTINAVYTWRFAPGSDLIVSYKSNLTKNSNSPEYFQNIRLLDDFYKFSGLNLKALYYLDVNRLRKA